MISAVKEHHISSEEFSNMDGLLQPSQTTLMDPKPVNNHLSNAFLTPLLPQGYSSCHQSTPESVSLNAMAKDTHMRNPTAHLELCRRSQLTGQFHEPMSSQCSPPTQVLAASWKSHQSQCLRTRSWTPFSGMKKASDLGSQWPCTWGSWGHPCQWNACCSSWHLKRPWSIALQHPTAHLLWLQYVYSLWLKSKILQ